jgi:Protein of unknown function (DUF4238)
VLLKAAKRRNQPRRQHIVPEMHLGRFANPARQVCVYQKGKPPRWSAVSKIAVERDYHEFSVGNTKSGYSIEDTLSNLEGRAASVRERVLNNLPASHDEIATWGLFVAALFLRSRKVRAQMSSRIAVELAGELRGVGELRQIQYELLKRGSLIPLAEVERQVASQLDKMLSSPAFLHLCRFHTAVPNLAHLICQKAWHILEAGEDSWFVTSDCPVFTAAIRERRLFCGTGFGLADTTVFLAIDPQHLFIAAPPTSKWNKVLGPADVDLINLSAIRFAHREVYAHKESAELQHAVDNNIDRITFGKDAYVSARDMRSQQTP